MRPQTADEATTDLISQLLALREEMYVTMALDDGTTHPDFYNPDQTYEVRKTNLKHNKKRLESFYTIFLYRPDQPRTADPLFKITVARDVPAKRAPRNPDRAKWNSHWVGHRNYSKYGSWSGTGHHSIEALTVVDAPETCPECGAVTAGTPH